MAKIIIIIPAGETKHNVLLLSASHKLGEFIGLSVLMGTDLVTDAFCSAGV